MSSPPTGTVTFLFTDLEDSTKLWERNPKAMQVALARHDEILREVIDVRRGYVFKTVGDAFCAVFPTAQDALGAALTAQRVLASEEWSEEIGSLRVRMALHAGAAEERDGDYFGPPLNRVARLLSAGHGGQVLLSLAAQELVRDQLPEEMALRDLGERRLKDLFHPERIFQLIAPDLPTTFPPLKTLDERINNLPAQPTPLIGRESELAQVHDLLRTEGVRLLTLIGPGGIGKTRLGLQVGADLLDEFEDGVFFVALATISDPYLVVPTVARTLDITETSGQTPEEALKDYLRNKELLFVLDNFEQVVEAAPLVGELLSACPALKVLATSRTVLRIYGEREFTVPPLELPDASHPQPVERLTQYEAVRLFVERAQAAKADFSVTNENALAVAEICAHLDGLPLAIELAAARIKLLPPQAMLARLGSRLKLLTGGARDLPERQRTLRATIEWSRALLDEGEQMLFGRLAVFSGGRTLEAIEAICDTKGDLPVDAFEGVSSLLDKSLLRQEGGPGGEPRFVMLETVHEFAREKLEESGEEEAIRRAHADYYLGLAEAAEPRLTTADEEVWLGRLEAEHDNLRAVLSWSLENGQAELALRLCGALWRFWYLGGHLSEGRRWLEEALAQGEEKDSALRAKALGGAGHLAWGQGDFERAAALREEGLKLFRQLGDKAGIAASLNGLSYVSRMRGDYATAGAMCEEALAIHRELDDTWGIAQSLFLSGATAAFQGDRAAARPLLEESVDLFREVGERQSLADAIGVLGMAALSGGDLAVARSLEEESLGIMQSLGYRQGAARALNVLGDVILKEGDHAAARALYERSFVILGDLNDKWWIAWCLEGLAGVAVAQGQPARSARIFGTAEALREAVNGPRPLAHQADHQRRVAAARAGMDEAAFAAAWAEGRAMTPEQAVAVEEPVPEHGGTEPIKTPSSPAYPAGLTTREVEVLRLVAQGLTSRQIATELSISEHTAATHVRRILKNLGLQSRSQIGSWLTQQGP
jgi:predicted ATPase/class 3 adenylate cyclase/DNA-binding CsgD family transcriptional regulator